jgi:hypothetical protein
MSKLDMNISLILIMSALSLSTVASASRVISPSIVKAMILILRGILNN